MSTATRSRRRNGGTALLLLSVVGAMVGLSFASVPLYRLFCQATGLGGTTQRAVAAPATKTTAVVTVRFDAATAPPWFFFGFFLMAGLAALHFATQFFGRRWHDVQMELKAS